MSIDVFSLSGEPAEHVRDSAESKLSEIEKFKALVTRKRRRNPESQYFVPQDVLPTLMSQEMVRKLLSEIRLEHYRIEELAHVVVPRAQKTFAILVLIGRPELILAFIEDDQLQPNSLDQKLPLQLHKLHAFLDDESAAFDFYREQWAFIAPVFSPSSLPRTLEKKTVLPFTESSSLGEGGFGMVHGIRIDPSHHSFAHSGQHRVCLSSCLHLGPRATKKKC